MIGPHTPQLGHSWATARHVADNEAIRARTATFMVGYDAGRHNNVVVLSDDPDWLDGFLTGRCDRANA